MKKRLLILISVIALIIAQQALPAFAGGSIYKQILFPIEAQWFEGPSFSKGKTNTETKSDYYYYELYPEQVMEADHYSLGGLPFDLTILYPEIDLSDEEFEDEPTLKAPPGGGLQTGGAPLGNGISILLILSVLFIIYKRFNTTHIMKASSSRAKREISRSTLGLLTSLRPQSGKQSSEKNRKSWIASSFLLPMTLLFCTGNLQAQSLEANPNNKFIVNDQWYSWGDDGGGTDAFTGATINVLIDDEQGACTEDFLTMELYDSNSDTWTNTVTTSKGTATIVGTNDTRGLIKNRILYTVNHDGNKNFTAGGQDVLSYRITCGSITSTPAKVLINIADQPDNIVWEGCFLDPEPINWGISEIANRPPGDDVSTFIQPIAGDLNGDGIPEIVVGRFQANYSYVQSNSNNNILSNGIFIYWGNKDKSLNHMTRTSINLGERRSANPSLGYAMRMQHQGIGPMGIIKTTINGVEKAIIVVASKDGLLRAYDPAASYTNVNTNTASTPIWTSNDGAGSNVQVVPNIPTINSTDRFYVAVSFADFNGDGIPEVFVGDRIFSSVTGALLAKGDDLTGNRGKFTSRGWNSYFTTVADVNADGTPDLLAGNKVYKVNIANSLTPDATNSLETIREAPGFDLRGDGSVLITDGMTVPVDINGDGNLDILYRTWAEDYDATFKADDYDSKNNTIGNTPQFIKQQTIAFYAWDTQTEQIIASRATHVGHGMGGIMGGISALGDVSGDGKIEIVMTTTRRIRIYHQVGNSFEQKYILETSDDSGATGISLFDFDSDGTDELVYRDQTHLRILKIEENQGTGDYELQDIATFAGVCSGTGYEFPLILDANGDNHADIVTTGRRTDDKNNNSAGSLRIFSAANEPWALTQSVWNQFGYNPVFVNNDLSVPKRMMNTATVFITKKGESIQPYNNFMRQANRLDNQGKMFRYGPDLTFDPMEGDYGSGVAYTKNGTNLDVTIYVLNQGDTDFALPLQISIYDKAGGNLAQVYTISIDNVEDVTKTSIEQGKTEVVKFSIPLANFSVALIDPHVEIQVRLNDKDKSLDEDPSIPIGDDECLYYNNYYPSALYSSLPTIACPGEDVTLQMFPNDGTYTYEWYDAPIEGTSLSGVSSDTYSCTVAKNNEQVQLVYVDVYFEGTKVSMTGRYQVKLYLRPQELVWTGAAKDHDWHNIANWYESAEVTPKDFLIPRKCTNVLIPDGLSYYPDLSKTTYTTFSEAECADIRFEFGGEVARTDMLDYDRAFVQYNFGYYTAVGKTNYAVKQGFVKEKGGSAYTPSYLKRDRYYALSIPLNNVATGDFSVGGYPGFWQMKYEDEVISGSSFAGFTQPYNSLGTVFNADQLYATALWVAKDNDNARGESSNLNGFNYQQNLNALEGIIEIPFFEDTEAMKYHRLHTYNSTTKKSTLKYFWQDQDEYPEATSYTPAVVDRGDDSYRFIFDGKLTTDKEFLIEVPTGKEIMIGNPSMSTLDFDAFYATNSSNIENYYRTFDSESYSTNNGFTQTDYDASGTTPIAPLQAFFIKTKGTAGSTVDLVYPFKTASITRIVGTGHSLRSGGDMPDANTAPAVVRINAEQSGHSSHITLALGDSERENIEQLFYRYAENTPQLYLKDEAGKRNAVQFEGRAGKEIPLGIQFKKEATVTLSFNDIEDLPLESLSLVDTKTGTETNLLKTGSYTFVHDADGERFVLRVGRLRNTTGIDELDAESTVNVYPEGNRIVVSSDQAIAAIEVYDTQGRLVIRQTATDDLFINDSGIYIVRVTLANGERKAIKVTL